MPLLSPDDIQNRLSALPGWEVRDGLLTKTFVVRSFAHGVLFIGAIGQLAEAANHHPDVTLHGYKNVTVSLSTHSEGGITQKDFDLAAQIEKVPHKPVK
ncbi:MAG TPA: 4a-hydroxytetrahydrobiopterin dehydratase [Anaerolineales bacterium]|nr:4a-hydroxytetrahydrobiopterin dehydratase [Anaerolineales bacterium]